MNIAAPEINLQPVMPLSHGLSDQVCLSVFQVDLIEAPIYSFGAADVNGDMCADTHCYPILSVKYRRMVVLFSIRLEDQIIRSPHIGECGTDRSVSAQ